MTLTGTCFLIRRLSTHICPVCFWKWIHSLSLLTINLSKWYIFYSIYNNSQLLTFVVTYNTLEELFLSWKFWCELPEWDIVFCALYKRMQLDTNEVLHMNEFYTLEVCAAIHSLKQAWMLFISGFWSSM